MRIHYREDWITQIICAQIIPFIVGSGFFCLFLEMESSSGIGYFERTPRRNNTRRALIKESLFFQELKKAGQNWPLRKNKYFQPSFARKSIDFIQKMERPKRENGASGKFDISRRFSPRCLLKTTKRTKHLFNVKKRQFMKRMPTYWGRRGRTIFTIMGTKEWSRCFALKICHHSLKATHVYPSNKTLDRLFRQQTFLGEK